MSAYAIYRRFFSRALGEGKISAFKNLDITDADFLGLQKELGLRRGQRFLDNETGKVFRLVRARAAFAVGNTLQMYVGNAARLPTATGASTKAIITHNKTYVDHEVAGGEIFNYSGTDAYEGRFIIDNDGTNNLITVAERDSSIPGVKDTDSPDAFTVAPDGTTISSIVVPYEYIPSAAATDVVKGVALGTTTSGNWTIVQETGLCPTLTDGTSALAVKDLLVPSATSGTAKVLNSATAAEIPRVFGMIMHAYAVAAANLCLVDLFCNRNGGNNQ